MTLTPFHSFGKIPVSAHVVENTEPYDYSVQFNCLLHLRMALVYQKLAFSFRLNCKKQKQILHST